MSEPQPRCFECQRSDVMLFLVDGAWWCRPHSLCSTCGVPLPEKAVYCTCHKYGYADDEDKRWCSDSCIDSAHPEPAEIDE